jgi:hypothetical protein
MKEKNKIDVIKKIAHEHPAQTLEYYISIIVDMYDEVTLEDIFYLGCLIGQEQMKLSIFKTIFKN